MIFGAGRLALMMGGRAGLHAAGPQGQRHCRGCGRVLGVGQIQFPGGWAKINNRLKQKKSWLDSVSKVTTHLWIN